MDECWLQKDEDFRREKTVEFHNYNTIHPISDVKRAPCGVLEECRSKNLEKWV